MASRNGERLGADPNVVVAVVVERVTDADKVQKKRAQVLRAGTCEQMFEIARRKDAMSRAPPPSKGVEVRPRP
jgi:hypothetical protein